MDATHALLAGGARDLALGDRAREPYGRGEAELPPREVRGEQRADALEMALLRGVEGGRAGAARGAEREDGEEQPRGETRRAPEHEPSVPDSTGPCLKL